MLKVTGLTDGEINRPLIRVVTSQNDITPGHVSLDKTVETVKEGVLLPGRTSLVFPTIGVCDDIAMGHKGTKYSLVVREPVAGTIECMVKAHRFDASVLTPNCDKVIPDTVMAALRLNVSSTIVSGESMLAGKFKGKKISLLTMFETVRAYEDRTALEGDLCELEDEAYPACGPCSGVFTVNPMNYLAEVSDLALPGNGTIPAVYLGRIRPTKYTGVRIMDLLGKGIKPRDMINEKSIKNTLTVDIAFRRSTNSILHLTAVANEIRTETNLNTTNKILSKIPDLCKLAPAPDTHIEDLYWTEGIQTVIIELSKKNLLELRCITATPKTHKEGSKGVVVNSSNVIRSAENPYSITGGIQVLEGNLAEDGAVIKKSAALEETLAHKGPTKVLGSEEETIETILSKKTIKGNIVVIGCERSRDGLGMREILSPASAAAGVGLDKYVVLITGGRFSGATEGAVIGYVSPETAEGGNIALIEERDTISIDIPNGKLGLLVNEEVLTRRGENLKVPEPKVEEGYLARYVKLASSADKGVILE